jgi:3-methyladenine DNA glycosylase AlkD
MSEAWPVARDIAARVTSAPGTSLEDLRKLRREVSARLRSHDPQFVIAVALHLIGQTNCPRWFAYELLNHNHAAIRELTPSQVEQLGNGNSSWDAVDAFACYVSGPAWRDGLLETADIERWTQSNDRWWRRAALVSTVPLNNTARGGHGDAERTLFVCDLLLQDRDDLVVKALSWALRELAKKEPRPVESYLRTHEKELAPRVVREVRNKLATGLKNPTRVRRSTG